GVVPVGAPRAWPLRALHARPAGVRRLARAAPVGRHRPGRVRRPPELRAHAARRAPRVRPVAQRPVRPRHRRGQDRALARPRAAAAPIAARPRGLPDRPVPAGRHVLRRRRDPLDLDLQRRLRPGEQPAAVGRPRRARAGLAGRHPGRPLGLDRGGHLEVVRLPHGDLPRGPSDHPDRTLRGGPARRRLPLAAADQHHAAAAPTGDAGQRHPLAPRRDERLRHPLRDDRGRSGQLDQRRRAPRLPAGLQVQPPRVRLGALLRDLPADHRHRPGPAPAALPQHRRVL
ncbi:MAG: ABC transporter, permease protein 1 (cluster 1, maltose/g3p/polyamine/iron), partial [uncultured Thermomicrobiales bacterium]